MSVVTANPAALGVQRNYDEMRAAMHAARTSLDKFFNAFRNPKPNQEDFLVKVFFVHRDKVHYLWIQDLELSADKISGRPSVDSGLPNLPFGERRAYPRDRITDWMYIEDGKIVGAYTTKVEQRQRRTQRLSGIRRVFGISLDN